MWCFLFLTWYRICKLDTMLDHVCMFDVYHWFHLSFPSEIIGCVLEVNVVPSIVPLPVTWSCCCSQGAVLLLLGWRDARGGRLGCPVLDYLITSTWEPWRRWLLVRLNPPLVSSSSCLVLKFIWLYLNHGSLCGIEWEIWWRHCWGLFVNLVYILGNIYGCLCVCSPFYV
jgi:hypothetical protein